MRAVHSAHNARPLLLWLRSSNTIGHLRRSAQRMGGVAPEWIQVFPFPTYVGELDGERFEWVTDEISQQSCVDFFNLRGNDLVIDYEHLSDKDVEAPAAGRIVELRAGGPSGLLARVEWTERARAQLESGEYYYDSPSFYWSPQDKRIYGLRHVALTNNPGSWNRPYITGHALVDYGITRTSQGAGGQRLQLVCAVTNHKEGRERVTTRSNVLEGFRQALARPGKVTGKELRGDLARVMEAIPDTDEMALLGDDEASADDARTVAELLGEGAPAPAPAPDISSQKGADAPVVAIDLAPLRLALGVDSDDPRELAVAVMNLKASTVPAETLRQLEAQLTAATTRAGEERVALEIARQRQAGKQVTPAFEAELLRVAKVDAALALSSLTGLQVTSVDLATQADTPAPTVVRLEEARQRAELKAAELPPGATEALRASTSANEETLAIAREKGLTYPEANNLRLASFRAA